MIIDTNKISEESLLTFAYLVTKDLRPNEDTDKWEATCIEGHNINYDMIFNDGLCEVEFGDVGSGFKLEYPKEAKSLKGLPESVDNFDISNLKIKEVDHLPYADGYILEGCEIEKFLVKFPNNNPYRLYVDANLIEDFTNFPDMAMNLSLSNCPNIKNLEGIPTIGEQVWIHNCKNLTDISQLHGYYYSLDISNLPITKLPKLPAEISTIEISRCMDLDDVSSLKNLSHSVNVIVKKCPAIDFYTLCIMSAKIDSDMEELDYFYKAYEHFPGEADPSRLEFEKHVYNYWMDKKELDIIDMLPFRTEEVKQMKLNYDSCQESLKKFKL
jgi:hypothetical protein